MATGFELFDRELSVAASGLDPESIRRELAALGKNSVAELVRSGKAPATYERFVNGRQGAAEETVQLPGPIIYVFSNWKLAIEAAIAELERRVPRKTGRYSGSFIVTVGGRIVRDYQSIAPTAEVAIMNFQPYTRKMEVGANGSGRRHFDLTKGSFNRRFGDAFRADVMFLNVAGGVHPEMPYILKGQYSRNRAARLANPSKFKRAFHKRKDMEAGQPITYPALVLNAV